MSFNCISNWKCVWNTKPFHFLWSKNCNTTFLWQWFINKHFWYQTGCLKLNMRRIIWIFIKSCTKLIINNQIINYLNEKFNITVKKFKIHIIYKKIFVSNEYLSVPCDIHNHLCSFSLFWWLWKNYSYNWFKRLQLEIWIALDARWLVWMKRFFVKVQLKHFEICIVSRFKFYRYVLIPK